MKIPSCQHEFDRLGGRCHRCGVSQHDLVLGPLDDAPTTNEIIRHATAILADARRARTMNATRCKVRLVSISGDHYGNSKARTVKFVPVTSGSEENKKFYAATPGGSLEFQISASAAESLGLDQGKIDSEFYVDITPTNA